MWHNGRTEIYNIYICIILNRITQVFCILRSICNSTTTTTTTTTASVADKYERGSNSTLISIWDVNVPIPGGCEEDCRGSVQVDHKSGNCCGKVSPKCLQIVVRAASAPMRWVVICFWHCQNMHACTHTSTQTHTHTHTRTQTHLC